MRTLVLASTSPYRLHLMRQLELIFHVAAPTYKERMESNVSAELLVKHQALQKAKSIAKKYDNALIIGSDQVFVDARHRVLGKPGTPEKPLNNYWKCRDVNTLFIQAWQSMTVPVARV